MQKTMQSLPKHSISQHLWRYILCLTLAFASSTGGLFAQGALLNEEELAGKETYESLARALSEPEKVYKLDLSKNYLKKLPPKFFELKNLQVLILSVNPLTELPENISSLKNLQVLSLSTGLLKKIPASIGKLENLAALSLAKNPLTGLPKEL